MYNNRCEIGSDLDDDILIAIVVEGASGDLKKQSAAHHSEFTTYVKLRRDIDECCDYGRAC